jgi:hypothetical protein
MPNQGTVSKNIINQTGKQISQKRVFQEMAWQRQLRDDLARKRQRIWQKRQMIRQGMLDKKVGLKLKVVSPGEMLKQIDWGEDAIYFVIFLVSVLADIVTAIIGLSMGLIQTAVAIIPFVGVALDVALTWLTKDMVSGTVILFEVVIAVLYIYAKHFKEGKIFLKIATLIGFDFLEMIPLLSLLPGFMASFFINYGAVLYYRALKEAYQQGEEVVTEDKEEEEEREKKIESNKFNRKSIF